MPYLDLADVRIWYNDTGGEGPAIVLLHAGAGNSTCWTEQVPAFSAAGLRVVTYDLRGFGKTETLDGTRGGGSAVGDLESIAEKLGLGRFFLVATAYGGFGGTEFALDHPDQLCAYVLSTGFGGVSDPEYTAERQRLSEPDFMKRPAFERELGASYRAANPDGVERFKEMEHAARTGEGPNQSLRQPVTLARLETMRVPSMIIAGDEDGYAPPPLMRMLADHIPDSRFEVIEGAGHSAFWEKPAVWNALVLDFVNQHC